MTLRSSIRWAALPFLAALAAAAFAQGTKPSNPSWETYQILVTNNMFLRDRSAAIRPSPEMQTPPSPQKSTVLTGIVRQGQEYIAFLEDTQTHATAKVRAGEPVCQGRLTSIAMHYVDYEKDGATTRIEIGKNLEGAAADLLPLAASQATPSATVGAPSGAPGSAADILERLRQKRLKEIGK